jgi:SP family general alpha glucoside:H+ symporter-like MFS transporter
MGSTTHVAHVEHCSAVEAAQLEADVVGIDDDVLLKMSRAMDNLGEITQHAHQATMFEHQMTFTEAIRLYHKAMAFSVLLSLAIVMEGYDTSLLGSFYGYPEFQKKFGIALADGTYQLTSSWQSGLQNGAQVGEILGLIVAGMLADRFGYKLTMLGALFMIIGCIFLFFFAQNIGMLMAAELLCGLPWGAFQTLTTTYAAEVGPIVLRPYLTSFVNMCVSKKSSNGDLAASI